MQYALQGTLNELGNS